MAARSKRNVKLPKHLQDAGYIDPATFGGEPKAVYRLVKKEELTGSLLHQTVYVLWPDDGIWYQAVVKKLRASDMLATLYYTRTDELENDVDMNELVETKQIAFRELRPTSYELGEDEILCTKENQDGEDEGYGLEEDDEDEEPADDDDDEEEAPGDEDDEDYHVGEGEADVDDEGPLSGSKRKASRIEDDEAGDARALGQNLLNSILGETAPKPAPVRHIPKQRPSARSQAAQAAARDQEKRNKLREALTVRINKAVQEAHARGEDPAMYDTARVDKLVTDIEAALYEYVGRAVGKPYLDKARSLSFNLNDPSNPDLRRAVLTGTVSAVRLVRMSPEEMAPKQLQEERRKLEEKSLKMSVLPEGTSFINYVTRREELVQRDEGRTRTPPPRGGSPEGPKLRRPSSPPILQGPPVAPVPTGPLIKSPPSAPSSAGAAPGGGAAFAVDWAAIRAQAATAAEEAKAVGQLEGFDDDLMAADLLVDDPAQNEVVTPPTAPDTDRPASPLQGPLAAQTSRLPPALAHVQGLDLWEHAGLPAGGIVGPGGTPPDTLVWASGTLSIPGSGKYAVEATSLCGGGDLAAMFSGLTKVEVEGRVGEEKLERFLHDLRNSRSRSVTLALLTAVQEASQDAAELETFPEVVAGYASRKRAGVAHIASGLEMYFIAPHGLGKQLLRTVHDSALQGDAPPAALAALPSSLSNTQMIVAVVHSKSWKPPAPSTTTAAAPVAGPDEYDPMQAPLMTLPSVDPLQPTQSSVPGGSLPPAPAATAATQGTAAAGTAAPAAPAPAGAALPFEIPDAAALSALLSSLPPAGAPGTTQAAPSGDAATDQAAVLPPNLDLNALNDLAATLLGPAAADPGAAPMAAPVQQPQQQQPPQPTQQLPPRPMFRDPRAGPTVPLDLPPELAAELQRLRGGVHPAGMAPPQPLPVAGGGHGGSRRNKWDVGPRADPSP